MSAEISTDIELHTGQTPYFKLVPHVDTPDQEPSSSPLPEVPLHPDLTESVVHITKPDSHCFPDCPIIKHGISEIMDEPNKEVVKSIARWIEGVHDECKVGPQTSRRPRFFIIGAEIEEVTCGSQLSMYHKKISTNRILPSK